MTETETETATALQRPKRADARRNYDALVAAARELFAAQGTSAPLEDVAERAGVGIGTLYRNFPTRQALLEAVYLTEIEAMAQSASELAAELGPWEALEQWLRRYVGFAATKRALNDALLEAPESDVLASCRTALLTAGTSLVDRAQEAGAVRADAEFGDIARMVGGIAMVPGVDDEQRGRILQLALDGLRFGT